MAGMRSVALTLSVGGCGFHSKKSHAVWRQVQPERIGLDSERASAPAWRPEIGHGEAPAGTGCFREEEAIGPGGVAPVVYGDDRSAVLVAADPEWRQFLWKRKPVVLRLAFRGAEEVNRLGSGSPHQAKDIRIAKQRQPVGGQ